ncbi:DUF397 domain-containing protein [Streptomyces botrytidirepellens]|uniref:DUF397 domain-containing protein n=1 Tax=Streptomyces botrytidirepellens TaxID=2486417 RepID=A0A3M8W0V4_9ACTN|nr:DUF397 domain-containing protein [Streptomyces botrytidirepellens]RNG22311.1 DUF397 domain-containing protein [Streptomyces botrytidirepellens]
MSRAWRKSSYSAGTQGNECVELAATGGAICLRESDDPRVVLTTTPPPLAAFIRAAKAGEFDGLTE